MTMRQMDIMPRLKALRQTLKQKNLDAMLVVDESNVSYLSGYSDKEAFLFISGHDNGSANIFITDFRYLEVAGEDCPDFEIVLHKNSSPIFSKTVAGLCAKYGIKRLGFEYKHIYYDTHDAINDEAEGVELCPTVEIVEDLRKVKDEAEIERLQRACEITDNTFAEACRIIRPGISERELEWEMLSSVRKQGAGPSFSFIVVSGARGSLPHGRPSDKPLQEGEFITMDFGAMYMGYHADMTRTVFLGNPSRQQRRLYDIVLTANLNAQAIIRAGIHAVEPNKVAHSYIDAQGYGENFGHGLGHGVGLDIHERPFMNMAATETLEENCFITVEPGIYLPGVGGIRIEDTVWVQKDGCKSMFTSTKDLICL